MALKTNEREYRDFTLTVEELESKEEGKMMVRGYASTFNEPYTLYSDDAYEVREQIAGFVYAHNATVKHLLCK